MVIIFHNSFLISIITGLFAILLLPASADAQNTDRLLLNTRLQKTIQAGETHKYQFEATTGQYLRFAINRSTVRIILEVTGRNGLVISRLDCYRCDSVSMSGLTKETGVYQLSIGSNEGADVKGRYDIAFAENRSAVDSDHKRIAPESAFSEGDRLQAKWTAPALRKALNSYNIARLGWKMVGDRAGQSRALRAMGNVYQTIGNLEKAHSSYKQAYILADDDARLKARATLGLGFAAIISRKAKDGVEYGKEALALSRTVGDKSGEIQSLFCIGDGYSYQSAPAVTFYEEALALAKEGDDLHAEATALCELSYEYGITAKMLPIAIQNQKEAMVHWQRLGDKRGLATSLITLGKLTSLSGEKQQALAFFHEAETTVKESGEPASQARLYNGLGFVLEALGELRPALEYYLKALQAWQAAKLRNGEVETLAQIGRLYQEMGESQIALANLLKAKQLATKLESSSDNAWVSTHLGTVYYALGREKEALDAYEEALRESAKALPWIRTLALNGKGKIYHRRGDYKEALAWYTQALTLTRESHEPFGEVSTLNNIARAERDSGNLDLALKTLDKAIYRIEELRAKMAGQRMRTSYFAFTFDVYELTIDLHMRLSQLGQNSNYVISAFELAERARARSLLDMLIESKAQLSPETNSKLVKQELDLLFQIAKRNRELAQMYANSMAQMQIQIAEQELQEFIARKEVVQSLMRAASPLYPALTQPEPVKLDEIQQLLDSETMLLEYSLGDDKSYLWAITTDSINSFQLPPQAEIEKVARQVYELLVAPNQTVIGETHFQQETRISRAIDEYPKAALRLSQMILAPAKSLLGRKRLVIVADGALQYIPFAALPAFELENDKAEALPTDDSHLFIEEHEIIYLPSASVLSAIRRELESRKPAAKAIAVIADPVFNKTDAKLRLLEIRQGGNSQNQTRTATLQRSFRQMEIEGNKLILDRLPFSHEEAMAILSIAPQGESLSLLNFQANKQTVISSELNQYRFVHFATHGLLNSNRPELSKIFLSLVDQEGKPQDGFLQLHDIYKLRLPAELVVLSACQTALGKEIKGEGLVGLTRGFMYAGASRVVASLWNVNDAATAELMSHFYKHIFQDKQRPAEALRNAQRTMLKQKRWESPYFWAAFTIQGEWK